MKKRSKTVLILSGGMESAVISALAHQKADSDLHAVFVDYGQKTRDHEATAVQRLSRRYGMQMETIHLSLPYLEDHLLVDRNSVIYTKKSAEEYGFPWRETVEGNGMGHLVPLRNLIFLSLAASYADVLGATEIWTGFDYKQFREGMTSAERCEAAPDKSEGFVSLAEETIRTISKLEPTIVTPVQGYTKKKTKERCSSGRWRVQPARTWRPLPTQPAHAHSAATGRSSRAPARSRLCRCCGPMRPTGLT